MEILDCTLRDGGFLNDWNWSTDFVQDYLQVTSKLPLDYLELGFWSKVCFRNYGKGYTVESWQEFVEQFPLATNRPISFICNTREFENEKDFNWVIPCNQKAALFRLAARPHEIEKASRIIQELRSYFTSCKLSLQLTHVSHYSRDSFRAIIRQLPLNMVDYLYIADSDGALCFLTDDYYVELLGHARSLFDLKLGFHPHNNLQLAYANSIVCKQKGFDIVDGSICGLGKGGGNLHTELWLLTNRLLDIRSESTRLFYQFIDRHSKVFAIKNDPVVAQLSGHYNLYNELIKFDSCESGLLSLFERL